MRTTSGTLLDGRVRYAQPEDGYRTGIEPVLLAASIPARDGETVLDGGTGAGAGLLCLASRVPGVRVTGIELDPATAELARQNLRDNGVLGEIVTADLTAWSGDPFDHAFSNPPWHDPDGTPSPDPRRRLALQVGAVAIEAWVAALRSPVRPGGTVTVIVPAAQTGRTLAALRDARVGALVLLPLWPKAGRDAKLVLIQGRAGRGGPDRLTSGLVLHGADGRFSQAVESVLRDGAALSM